MIVKDDLQYYSGGVDGIEYICTCQYEWLGGIPIVSFRINSMVGEVKFIGLDIKYPVFMTIKGSGFLDSLKVNDVHIVVSDVDDKNFLFGHLPQSVSMYKVVNKIVEKCINEIFDSQLRWYSELRKRIEEEFNVKVVSYVSEDEIKRRFKNIETGVISFKYVKDGWIFENVLMMDGKVIGNLAMYNDDRKYTVYSRKSGNVTLFEINKIGMYVFEKLKSLSKMKFDIGEIYKDLKIVEKLIGQEIEVIKYSNSILFSGNQFYVSVYEDRVEMEINGIEIVVDAIPKETGNVVVDVFNFVNEIKEYIEDVVGGEK